jgi:hypothetical protein
MHTDPAQLILFGEMSSRRFFDEAQQQGIPLEQLKDEATHNRVLNDCLIKVRKATAQAVAFELGMAIRDDQAYSIARNSLTPEVMAGPAPLTPEDRKVAKILYFHAVKAAVARQGGTIADRAARSKARRMVAAGERGTTSLQRISHASGCLVVLTALVLGGVSALLSAIATAASMSAL